MGSGSDTSLQDILSLFSGQAQAATANGGTVPPMPERNPAFHTLPGDPVASPAGGLLRGAVPPMPERNPIFRPEEGETPVQSGLLGVKPTDTGGPGQTVVKTPPRDGNSPWRDKGYTVQSVPAVTTTSGSAPLKSQPDLVQGVADAAPATAPAGSPRASLFGDASPSGTGNADPSSTAPVQAVTNDTMPAAAPQKGLFASKMFAPEGGGFIDNLKAKLQNSGTDPLMQIGLGLLAGGHDGTNPYPLIMKGLSGIQNQQIAGVGSDTNTEKARAEAAQRAAEQQAMLRMLSEYKKPAEDTGVAAMRTKIVK